MVWYYIYFSGTKYILHVTKPINGALPAMVPELVQLKS